jgi:hypothetical protein
MKRIILTLLIFLMCVGHGYAANKVRAFTELIGGGTGALDAIPQANFEDGDISLVVKTDTQMLYFYVYDEDGEEAQDEVDWTVIRPADYDVGVHDLVSVAFLGLNMAASTDPKFEFRDSESPGTDKAAGWIKVVYVDGIDGAENADIFFEIIQGGADNTEVLRFDESDDRWESTKQFFTTSTLNGKLNTVAEATATTWNVTTEQAQAGTYFVNTNDGTKTFVLPTAEAGMAVCVKHGQGIAQILRIDTDGTDFIVKSDGTRTSAGGEYYGATSSNSNAVCVIAVDATDWYVTGEVGTWTEE